MDEFGHVADSYHRTFQRPQLSVTVHTQRQVRSLWCTVPFNVDTVLRLRQAYGLCVAHLP